MALTHIDTYAHGESIYNILPATEIPQERLPMYRSKHNPRLAPTSTTFGNLQTSHPIAMNLSGYSQDKVVPDKKGRSFGKPRGSYSNRPDSFMKKSASTGTVQSLKEMQRTNPNILMPSNLKPKLKPDVPKTSDVPVMNLVTAKNFVVANAVETILAAPKKMTSEAKDYLKKEDYGKVPKYLKNIKQDIEAEYDYISMLQEEEDKENQEAFKPMAEEDRLATLQSLKAKWEAVNTEYQGQTHLLILNSRGEIYRKEKWEAELSRLEKDIEMLNKKNILVARDQ